MIILHNTRHFEETPRPENNKIAKQAFLIVILIKILCDVFSEHSWGTIFNIRHVALWLHNLVSTHQAHIFIWLISCKQTQMHGNNRCRDVLSERNKTIETTLTRPDWTKKNKIISLFLWSWHGMCYITAGDVNSLKQRCIKRFFHN